MEQSSARPSVATDVDPTVLWEMIDTLLPGIEPDKEVGLAIPATSDMGVSWEFQNLAENPEQRQALRESLLALDGILARARQEGITPREAAMRDADVYEATIEKAVATLLDQNATDKATMKMLALFFSNLQEANVVYTDMISVVFASPTEIASAPGVRFLNALLSSYADRPDSSESFAFVAVPGWVGSKSALEALGRVVHKHRAVLVSAAPPYDSKESLRRGAGAKGTLKSLAGNEAHHRHMVLLANEGRVCRRYEGRHATEASDTYVPLVLPWLGEYMLAIARGRPWLPPVGRGNPLAGVSGVRLDLTLALDDEYMLYAGQRVNPAILVAKGGTSTIIWGPLALYAGGRGVQTGEAIVESIVARFADFVLKQHLQTDLEKARKDVQAILTGFVVANTGPDRMFRAGSFAKVTIDHDSRALQVTLSLIIATLGERAEITVDRPLQGGGNGDGKNVASKN